MQEVDSFVYKLSGRTKVAKEAYDAIQAGRPVTITLEQLNEDRRSIDRDAADIKQMEDEIGTGMVKAVLKKVREYREAADKLHSELSKQAGRRRKTRKNRKTRKTRRNRA